MRHAGFHGFARPRRHLSKAFEISAGRRTLLPELRTQEGGREEEEEESERSSEEKDDNTSVENS